MIHYSTMRLLAFLFVFVLLAPLSGKAEYEMHIPNCTQKGVENCGGFCLIMKLAMSCFVDLKVALI